MVPQRLPRDSRQAAVSEITATALLIALSVGFFAVVGLQVLDLPAPARGAQPDLGASLNSTYRVLLTSRGGDPLPIPGIEVRLGTAACVVIPGPAMTVDGPREDGNGVLDTGERLATTCDATSGGLLTVTGGAGVERRVLLHVVLPPAGGATGFGGA